MKVKKFKNLWTMGLIICCTILIVFELLKFIFPNLIVGVAEIPSIVEFGNYVDSHLWAYYLFNGLVSFAMAYFYYCACCRKKHLSKVGIIIAIAQILLVFVVQEFIPEYAFSINIITMLICPAIMCFLDKRTDIKYLYSTVTCFSINALAQIFSLHIRDISTLISYPNSATFAILTIDAFIWMVLLYNFYNFKED